MIFGSCTEYKINTSIHNDTILQEFYSVSDEVKERISKYIFNTQELQIKNALIALGWTPPLANNKKI